MSDRETLQLLARAQSRNPGPGELRVADIVEVSRA
jgi:hypothetical protein